MPQRRRRQDTNENPNISNFFRKNGTTHSPENPYSTTRQNSSRKGLASNPKRSGLKSNSRLTDTKSTLESIETFTSTVKDRVGKVVNKMMFTKKNGAKKSKLNNVSDNHYEDMRNDGSVLRSNHVDQEAANGELNRPYRDR